MSKFRVLSITLLVGALASLGLSAGPALAEDQPVVWQPVPGAAITVDDLSVDFEAVLLPTNPWGLGAPAADPVPYLRPVAVNNSSETRYLSVGMDIAAHGVIEPLWSADTWSGLAGENPADAEGFVQNFLFGLAPGESIASSPTGLGLDQGVPQWAGRTFVLYELSGPLDTNPTATVLTTYTAPGRFVPVNFGTLTDQNVPSIGQPLEVSGTGASSDVFPGVTATVAAAGLVANESLELWLIPDFDYFFLFLLGGGLPDNSVPLGAGIVAADGTLSATFTVPSDTPISNSYQLVAGVPGERYWPAGSYRNFSITEPDDSATASTPTDGSPLTMEFALTTVTFTFPGGTTEGTTTAAVTATGPTPGEFTLASSPPLYYHLDTTSTLAGEATVCITYDPVTIPGTPPRLYHYETVAPSGYRWVDITTSSEVGTVCGLTSSFSPFVLGYPPAFEFSGFFPPVSMDDQNIAKAGQAIPVKFSLGGDQGLDVMTSAVFISAGTATSFVGDPVETVAAGTSGLSYSAGNDQYTYVWKTSKSMAKQTGTFVLTLVDGTTHEFNVTFKK